MISIGIPYHRTPKTAFFLARLLESLDDQTYKDYEVVITDKGSMGENHNEAILQSKGDIVKMMQMDDFFVDETSLEKTVKAFEDNPGKSWLITANLHFDGEVISYPHFPSWNHQIFTGRNTLGSVSTLSLRKDTLLFNDELRWMIDVDMYWRLYHIYGEPILLNDPTVVVSWHENQQTNLLTEEEKQKEYLLMMEKYGK